MGLVSQAFKGIGLTPTDIFTHKNGVDVFTTLPSNFLTFVKTKDDIPKNHAVKMFGNSPPHHHCNFTNTFLWNEREGYREEQIHLGYCGFSVPNLGLDLWGFRKDGNAKTLATPNSAAFHITINRMDSKNKCLKDGLEEFVTQAMKNGFYIVMPDNLEQVNGLGNDEILTHFKTQKNPFHLQG